MSLQPYTAARSRTQLQPGMPGKALPVYQLMVTNIYPEVGFFEIQACTWDAPAHTWQPFDAWQVGKIISPKWSAVYRNEKRVDAVFETFSRSELGVQVAAPLVREYWIWILYGNRDMSTTDGWVASGLSWRKFFPPE